LFVLARHRARPRAFAVVTIVAMLALAACGGGGDDSDDAAPITDPAGGEPPTSVESSDGGNGDCFGTPGSQTARARYVNLFTNDTYPQGEIDVYQGLGADDPCGKKLATIAYGEATDYLDVNALDESGNWYTTAFLAGGTGEDQQIIRQSETWKGGEQVTIVFFNQDPSSGNPPAFGSDQVFFEEPTDDPNSTITTVPGKAVLNISASALQYTAPDEGWVAGVVGESDCLQAVGDTEFTRTNIGGTSLVQYPVDPGSIDLALYDSDPGTCSGEPDIGPVTIDAEAGSRTLVLAYGADPNNIDLLVLPVEG
jgi:hypothetical protein